MADGSGRAQDEDKLGRYRHKRDFSRTGEPAGTRAAGAEVTGRTRPVPDDPIFVIQHHLATADHYDFRLEIDRVLVSWAVPKGPSTDPRVRRLAKRTEDHPMDYADYEGVIAAGQYGGGSRRSRGGVVQVWDRGTFRNISEDKGAPVDAGAALARGHLTFVLAGEKISGGYSLIKTRGEDMWLLIKKKGAGADARRNPTSTETESVLSGRTMDQIAEQGP